MSRDRYQPGMDDQEVLDRLATKPRRERHPGQFRRTAALAGFIDDLKATFAESSSVVTDAEPVQRNDWIVQPAPRPVREVQKIELCELRVISSILIVEADRVPHHRVRRGNSPELLQDFE